MARATTGQHPSSTEAEAREERFAGLEILAGQDALEAEASDACGRRDDPGHDTSGGNGPGRGSVDREVQHRVRNILAVVRSVLRRTVAAGGPGDHMVDHFSGRLDALARAHQAEAGARDGRVDLEELIRGELHAFRFGDDPRVSISGPAIGIVPESAQTLGLAFHEMVTNSFKFGALSSDLASDRTPGHVAVAWAPDGGWLRIDWTESNVPIVGAAPRRHGFGREFIEHAVPYQLGGTVRFDLLPGCLTCSLSLPLAALRTKKDERGWN